jgi:hypothetical protein
VEFWYNTTYHNSLNISPFQAFYGFPPPLTSELLAAGPSDLGAKDFLQAKQDMLTQLKTTLAQAQARTKKYADANRVERASTTRKSAFSVCRPVAVGRRTVLKLMP